MDKDKVRKKETVTGLGECWLSCGQTSRERKNNTVQTLLAYDRFTKHFYIYGKRRNMERRSGRMVRRRSGLNGMQKVRKIKEITYCTNNAGYILCKIQTNVDYKSNAYNTVAERKPSYFQLTSTMKKILSYM